MKDSGNKFFLNIAVYSSLNQRKISELFVESTQPISSLFDWLNCVIAQMQNDSTQRFLFIENQFIVEHSQALNDVNLKHIYEKMSLESNKLELIVADSLSWEKLNF